MALTEKKKRAIREKNIKDQNQRNRRLDKAGQKKPLKCHSVYRCWHCNRDVEISWKILHNKAAQDIRCRVCDRVLSLHTACLEQGVIPRLDMTR